MLVIFYKMQGIYLSHADAMECLLTDTFWISFLQWGRNCSVLHFFGLRYSNPDLHLLLFCVMIFVTSLLVL